MKKIIISEWRQAWKWLSMWVGSVAVTFGMLPPDTQLAILVALSIPQERVAAVIGGVFILARIVNQTPKSDDDA